MRLVVDTNIFISAALKDSLSPLSHCISPSGTAFF
jgi:predicted nucleic acid-binding protein